MHACMSFFQLEVLSAPQLTFSESFFLISITDLLMGNSRLALDLYGLEEDHVVYCQAIYLCNAKLSRPSPSSDYDQPIFVLFRQLYLTFPSCTDWVRQVHQVHCMH